MSNHNSQRSINLHHQQIHDAETRRDMRNAARLRSIMDGHAVAMRFYHHRQAEEMLVGFCIFVSLALVSVGGLMLNYPV